MMGWTGTLTVFLFEAAGEPDGDWSHHSGQPMSTVTKSSIMFAGGVVGMLANVLLGMVSDRRGRVKAIVFSMILSCVAMCGYLVARTPVQLGTMMMLTPFSRDGVSMISGTLLAEWVPSSNRGSMLTLCHGMWNLGRLAITLWWTAMPPVLNWHGFLLGASTVPVLVASGWLLARRRMEAPRWFVARQDWDGARRQLRRLGIDWDPPAHTTTSILPRGGIQALRSWGGQTQNQRTLFTLCIIAILHYLVSSAMSLWFIIYLERTTPESVDTALVLAPLAKITTTVVFCLGPSNRRLIDRLPRRTWMCIGFLATGLLIILHTWAPAYQWVAWIVCLREFCGEIVHSAWGLYLTELFPTECRSTGIGFVALTGHVGTILGSSLSGELMDMDVHLPLRVWSACLLLASLLSVTLPILKPTIASPSTPHLEEGFNRQNQPQIRFETLDPKTKH